MEFRNQSRVFGFAASERWEKTGNERCGNLVSYPGAFSNDGVIGVIGLYQAAATRDSALETSVGIPMWGQIRLTCGQQTASNGGCDEKQDFHS
jgi:hypothetical protein